MFTHKLKSLILPLGCLLFAQNMSAQITFTQKPTEYQIVPRSLTTNLGLVTISGTIQKHKYDKLVLTVFRDNSFFSNTTKDMVFDGDTAQFSFQTYIKAELANYRFFLTAWGNNQETIVLDVPNVCAGDAYIIQGQSNAEANNYTAGCDKQERHNFVRVYGSGNEKGEYAQKWFLGNGDNGRHNDGGTGQWGQRLARRLTEETGVPVAIFNGAHGGQSIRFFLRDNRQPDNVVTNYGRLWRRLHESGFANSVRGLFWHQGENDAHQEADIDDYKSNWTALYEAWMSDFPSLEQIYICQIRFGCSNDPWGCLKVQEAQRQLANSLPKIQLMTTNMMTHFTDTCHYPFIGGYQLLADCLFPLAVERFYHQFNPRDFRPIEVLLVRRSASQELSLELKSPSSQLIAEAGAEDLFTLHGDVSAKVISMRVEGTTLILTLNRPSANVTALSFGSRRGAGSPNLKSVEGVGMVCFYMMAVLP